MINKKYISEYVFGDTDINLQIVNVFASGGELVASGNVNTSVDELGFLYSRFDEEPELDSTERKTSVSISKSFSSYLDTVPGENYFIRAYAIVNGDVFYSNVVEKQARFAILSSEIESLYLTLGDNPHSSIDVMYTTKVIGYSDSPNTTNRLLNYRKEGTVGWIEAESTLKRFPFTGKQHTRDEIYVNRVQLSGLDEGQIYEFNVDGGDVKKLKTIDPADFRGIFIGDIQHRVQPSAIANMLSDDPDFIVLGGDNASADNGSARFDRWEDLFWYGFTQHLEKSNGVIVPIVPQMGNHDATLPGYSEDLNDGEMHYTSFPWHREIGGYGTFEIGSKLCVFLLNTMHTSPIITGNDEQSNWLKDTLPVKKSGFDNVIMSMHVPAFPWARSFDNFVSVRIRNHWVPIFQNNNIEIVFDAHEHVHARTEKLINMEIDGAGVRYINLVHGANMNSPRNYRTLDYAEITYGVTWQEGDEPHETDGDPANPDQARTFALYNSLESKVEIKDSSGVTIFEHSFSQ